MVRQMSDKEILRGQLMAQLVVGEKPCVDPAPFRYIRYFDGSRPRPTTGL